jgi:pyruvate formate lyase activating enzyme
LTAARRIALKNGLRYVYTGNVSDREGGTTFCQQCRRPLIARDYYEILDWHLTNDGRCDHCGARCAGVFEARPGEWGSRRQPVRLSGA